MASTVGDITLNSNGTQDIVVSGYSRVQSYKVNKTVLTAHPSNGSVIYIRNRVPVAGTFGYPLTAGASVTLTDVDLYNYTVSGAISSRLAFVAEL